MNAIKCLLIFILSFGILPVKAQNIKLYASPQGALVLDSAGDTLCNPWCGGWVTPQFSNIDMNGDGLQDIFVFQSSGKGGNRVLTFLNAGNGQYVYAPDYESLFPQLQYWALLADYNNDGKPDIFTFSSSVASFQDGIDVYENISDHNGLKFKKVTTNLLRYQFAPKQYYPIYASTTDIPVITDIDGDGDIDIIAFDVAQLGAYWYKNMAVEDGYSLDSLVYTNPTVCWGKFSQTTAIPPVMLPGCGKMANAHGSSSLLAVDLDNDGDKDVLYGNIYVNGLEQLTNGRISNGVVKSKTDTMVSIDPAIVGSGNILAMGSYPCPYSVEATGDSLKDIVVAPGDFTNDPQSHKTYLYKNTGLKQGDHFQFVTDNFLQQTMVDDGEHSAPAFFDYNGDGLMDLVIASRANASNGYEYDHLSLYKNIGTPDKAVFEKVDNDFASVVKYQLAYTAPTFGDIDGDGRPDMLLGRSDGKIMFFKNISDSGGSLKMKLISPDFQNISAGSYSTPCLAHISSDTLLDLVLGCDSGNFIYYKNTGTKTSPIFSLVTNNFGNVRTNVFYWGNYQYDTNGNIIDSSLVMEPDGRSSPVITDLDHDGKPDMISGSTYGEMFFWFDISDSLKTRGTFARTDTVFYNTVTHAKEDKYLGFNTMPAAADLNNDKLPELLVGNYMGGTMYYGSKQVKPVIYSNIPQIENSINFDVYPNPAHQIVNLQFSENIKSPLMLSIVNMLGQQVCSATLSGYQSSYSINVSHLRSSVYFIRVQDNNGYAGIKEIVIQ